MEIKSVLNKPYSEEERINFIVEQNYNNGYEIRDTENALESWGCTEAEIAEQEAVRISNLHMTRGDVFRGLLLAKGVTRADIRGMIELMPDGTPEQRTAKEMAFIDFDEALEFYRGVALIDNLGVQLGITPEQMTAFFETKDWHELCTNEAV